MKLFINHFDTEVFRDKLSDVIDANFSLFVDDVPKTQDDLSLFNVVVLQEPNEYFGLHNWVIKHKELFQAIFTWDTRVLNICENARYFPFGGTWFKPEQYETDKEKLFQLSHLRGNLLKTYGHQIRHELFDRQNEIRMPKKFYDVYGDRYDIEDARKGKEFVFGDSMFGVAIENTSHNGYFTEKILDCFLMKTIPVYWGCSDIHTFFNGKGIIKFENADDVIQKMNNLSESYYSERLGVINQNYNLALQYVDYVQNIVNIVAGIIKYKP